MTISGNVHKSRIRMGADQGEGHAILFNVEGFVAETDEATSRMRQSAQDLGYNVLCLRSYWDRGLMVRLYELKKP